jgi:hypothetical protein
MPTFIQLGFHSFHFGLLAVVPHRRCSSYRLAPLPRGFATTSEFTIMQMLSKDLISFGITYAAAKCQSAKHIAVVIFRSGSSGSSTAPSHNVTTIDAETPDSVPIAQAPTQAPAALRAPVELLTAIFERLPARDAAAVTRVCRSWAHVGIAVLRRSPQECVLRELSSSARRAVGAAHVVELQLSSPSVGRILATPWPRLTTLCVSLTAVLAHQQRFCRFLSAHGCDAIPSSGSGFDVGGSDGTSASISGCQGSAAAASTSVLRSVTIGSHPRQYHRALPTDVFVLLALCSALRHYSNNVRLATEAAQAAIASF